MNIFVGSLHFDLEEAELRSFFEEYGEVTSVKIISDKFTGRSKGFGFVEMSNDEEAKKAIEELNGAEVEGRPMVVNESVEKKDGDRRGGGGGGFRGGNRSGGGGGFRGGDNRGGGGGFRGGDSRGGSGGGGFRGGDRRGGGSSGPSNGPRRSNY